MNNTHAVRCGRRAFTIVEVMIVLVIIGLIGAIVGINLVGAAEEARIRTTKATLQNIQSALKLYYGTNGFYPNANGELTVLVQQNILQLGSEPVDAWSTPIELFSNGAEYTIRSLGKDKTADTEDDLTVQPDHQ